VVFVGGEQFALSVVFDGGRCFSSPVVFDGGERKRGEKIGYESNLGFDFRVGGRMRERGGSQI
jgi:hypothetical protein